MDYVVGSEHKKCMSDRLLHFGQNEWVTGI